MGVLWIVWPLDGDMKDWLTSQAIEFPTQASRFPTGLEIKRAIQAMNLTLQIDDSEPGRPWRAHAERGTGDEQEWTNLQFSEYSDDEPQQLSFVKGSPSLIQDILKRLVPICGPLALINDAGDPPEVITA